MDTQRGGRRFARIETDALVDFTGSEVLLFHHIENISLGGISIRTPTIEEVGTPVFLAINFPDFNQSIEIEGEVVWIHEEDPKEMGIRFTKLGKDEQLLLERFLEARARK